MDSFMRVTCPFILYALQYIPTLTNIISPEGLKP